MKKACNGDSWKTLYEPFGRACEKARKERANCNTCLIANPEIEITKSSSMHLLESVARPGTRGETALQCFIQQGVEMDEPFFNQSLACGPLYCYFPTTLSSKGAEWTPYWVSMSNESLFIWHNYLMYQSNFMDSLNSKTSTSPIFDVRLSNVSALMGTGSSHLIKGLQFPTSYSFRLTERRDTGNSTSVEPLICFCANSFETLNRWHNLLTRRLAVATVNVDELVSLPPSSSTSISAPPLTPSISGRVVSQRSKNNALNSQSPEHTSPSFNVSPESAHRGSGDVRFDKELEVDNVERENKRLTFLNTSENEQSVTGLSSTLPRSFPSSTPVSSFSFPSALPVTDLSSSSSSSYSGIFARRLSIADAVGKVSDVEVGVGASSHSIKNDEKAPRAIFINEITNHSGSVGPTVIESLPSRLTSDTESSRSRAAARKADEESKARDREAAMAAELALVASLKVPVHGTTVPIVTAEKNPRLYAQPTKGSGEERRRDPRSQSRVYLPTKLAEVSNVLRKSNEYPINLGPGSGGMRDFVKQSTTYQRDRSSNTPSLLDRTIELGEMAKARRVRSPIIARNYTQSRMDTFHKSLGVNVPSSSLNSFQYTSGYERPGWKKSALGAEINDPTPYDPFDLFSSESEDRTGGVDVSFSSDLSNSVLSGPSLVVGAGAPKAFGIVALPPPLSQISSSFNSGKVTSSSAVIGVPRLHPRRNSSASISNSVELRALSPGVKRKVMWAGQQWPGAEASLLLNSMMTEAKETELPISNEITKKQNRKPRLRIDLDGNDDYDAEDENENVLRQRNAPPLSSRNADETKEEGKEDAFNSGAPFSLLIDHIADVEARLKKSEDEKEVIKGLLEVSLNGIIAPQSAVSSVSLSQLNPRNLNDSGVVERVLDSPLEVSSRLAMMMTAARAVRDTLPSASSTSFTHVRVNDSTLNNSTNVSTGKSLPNVRFSTTEMASFRGGGVITSSNLDLSKNNNLLSSSFLGQRVNESITLPQSSADQPYNPFNSPEKACPLNIRSTPASKSMFERSASGPPNFAGPPLLSSVSMSSSPRMTLALSIRNVSLLASYVYLIGGSAQHNPSDGSISSSSSSSSSSHSGFKTSRTSVEINADICSKYLSSAIRAFAVSSSSIDAPTSPSSSHTGRVYNVTRVFKADPFALSDAITTRRIPAMLLSKHSLHGTGQRTLLLVTVVDSVAGGGSAVTPLSQAVSLVFGNSTSTSSSILLDVLSGTMLASGGSVKFTIRAVSVTTSSGEDSSSAVLADLLLPVSHRNSTRPPTVTYPNETGDAPVAAIITGAAGVALTTAADCTRFCSLVKKRVEASLGGDSIGDSAKSANLAIVIAELESGASFSVAIQLCSPEGRGSIPSLSNSLCSKLIQRDAIISLIVV